MLDRNLEEFLLLDVTPLPLGIRVAGREGGEGGEFDVVVEQNSTIPTERRRDYTTVRNDQTSVDIEIFNGELGDDSRIGHFRLDGIEPAPKVELLLAHGPLGDLADTAQAYLDRPRRADLEAELVEGRHLEAELDAKLGNQVQPEAPEVVSGHASANLSWPKLHPGQMIDP